MPVETDADIDHAMAALEEGAVCALQLARDIRGLDRMLNDPEALPGRKTTISQYARRFNFFPAIIAWLAHNPDFDGVVELYRSGWSKWPNGLMISGKVYSPQDFERLVQYLRSEVKPLF